MAFESPMTNGLFTGEDKSVRFTIYQSGTTRAQIAAGTALIQDTASFALSWTVKKKATDDRAVIQKTTAAGGIAIVGVYNADPAINTQYPVATVTDDDLDGVIGGVLYRHELKRMDAGSETVLSYGDCVFGQAVHR